MPNPKTQRYIGLLATLGVLTSCFGCSLLYGNQLNAARAFLLLSWLILVPLFVYLLTTYRRNKTAYRRQLQQREKELEALGSAKDILSSDDEGLTRET